MATPNEEAPRPNTSKSAQAPDIYYASLSIESPSGNFDFTTQLPERFPIGLATSWDTPFNQPISEIIGGSQAAIGENISRALGQSSLNKWMSGAVWSSGSVLEISEIPFVLIARTDAKKEVYDPFIKLLSMVAPTEGAGGMLKAPGPHLLGQHTDDYGGERITFRIGKFFKMYPCIIESVQGDFDTQFDERGYPISATVSVTIKSFWSVSRTDIGNFFVGS